jgi:hypothetical protein
MSEGNIPEASWSKFTNKAGNWQIIYGGRLYNRKSRSTTINEFKCSNHKCTFDIFLAFTILSSGAKELADPLVVLRTNEEKGVKHKESCKVLTNDDLERLEQIGEFCKTIKPNTKLNQAWDSYSTDYFAKTSKSIKTEFRSVG